MNQDTSPKWPIWQTFAFRAFALYLFFIFCSSAIIIVIKAISILY
jgi:hypothetical protein